MSWDQAKFGLRRWNSISENLEAGQAKCNLRGSFNRPSKHDAWRGDIHLSSPHSPYVAVSA